MTFTAGASLIERDLSIHDWTGRSCVFCKGTGENKEEDYPRSCRECAGTGEEYAYVCMGPYVATINN
jgi:hypothetical protein